MPSLDAIDALTDSLKSWEAFRSMNPGVVDLRLAELKNIDLNNRDLSNCDFSGADLENANLDRCNIQNTIFVNSFLENISLVGSKVSKTDFTGARLRHSTFRDVMLSKVTFKKCNLQHAVFVNSNLKKCTFFESELDSVKFENTRFFDSEVAMTDSRQLTAVNCSFENCHYQHVTFGNSSLSNIRFETSRFTDVSFALSQLDQMTFSACQIVNLQFPETSILSMDMSRSNITGVDLSQYYLCKSIFMEVAFNNCIWPAQKGYTTLFGRYLISKQLMAQPVQDVKGIPPTLRREIADAQYLREITVNAKFPNNVMLRIWGTTTDYGQSLIRLSTISSLLVILFTSAFLFFAKLPAHANFFYAIYSAFSEITLTFIGISSSNITSFTDRQQVCITLSRIFGFLIMGLWIGMAANRLGKLSSE